MEVVRRADGRVIGTLDGGWLKKSIKRDEHVYHKTNAIAFDQAVFEKLEGKDLKGYEVTVDGEVYRIDVNTFADNCHPLHHKGHGHQWACPIPNWDRG